MTQTLQQVTQLLTSPGTPLELETKLVRGVPTRTWKNLPNTVPALLKALDAYAERDYVVYEGERYTYADIAARVRALTAHLQHVCGVRKGDRVALAMRNYPEWIVSFWAALQAGAIIVPLNAWWRGQELAYGLRDSGSRVLLCDDERAHLVEPHRNELGLTSVLVARAARELPPPYVALDEVLASSASLEPTPVEIDPEDDATIFYTSGTTGQPKGALGTHRNLCANIGSSLFARARAAARGTATSLPPQQQAAALLSVPLFHVTGCHSYLVAGSFNGNKIVLIHKWNPERALELIERERITQFGGVPSMVWQVLESPDFDKRDTSSVVAVSYGGAPAAPELLKRIKQVFPHCTASNGYGLTETSALTSSNTGIDYERKPDSVGVPVAACEVKVVGPDGAELPLSGVGELWIRWPNVVKGYCGKPEATAHSYSDVYLHTGDVARIDEEGFVYILDRAKDMLIRGGENVYCVEVEDVLYSHPAVMDAAVVGVPHRVLGEEVGAVVQLAPRASVTVEELRAFAAERLAGFKVPTHIELRSDPLPRNPNGKIMKREIKRELGWS
ncbi:MAG: class I adenylate-forming enzyme family protein [Polyangiales bacterium]